MKKLTANGFALLAAVATLATSVNHASAQDLAPGEYIVGSEQVISDRVVDTLPTSDGSTYSSPEFNSPEFNSPEYSSGSSYVGDSVLESGEYASDVSGSIGCSACESGACGENGTCGDANCSSCNARRGIAKRLTGKLAGLLHHNRSHVGDIGTVERSYGNSDLFYNYYTNGAANRANAQMYLSPLPVPPNVGHTFFTYQPFYPEEMLYWHKNKYHNYYDNGRGMNRTKATYFSPPIRQAVSNLYWNKLRLPR